MVKGSAVSHCPGVAAITSSNMHTQSVSVSLCTEGNRVSWLWPMMAAFLTPTAVFPVISGCARCTNVRSAWAARWRSPAGTGAVGRCHHPSPARRRPGQNGRVHDGELAAPRRLMRAADGHRQAAGLVYACPSIDNKYRPARCRQPDGRAAKWTHASARAWPIE